MPVLVVGIIAVVVLLIINFWWVFILLGIAFVPYWFYRKSEKEKQAVLNAKRAAEASRQWEIDRRADEQLRLWNDIKKIDEDITRAKSEMSGRLATVRSNLRKVEREFAEEAYSPFWDAIEQTAYSIDAFAKSGKQIEGYFSTLNSRMLTYQANGHRHPLPAVQNVAVKGNQLLSIESEVNQLHQYVRSGQRNINFATIFEQRRTNQLLKQGFEMLDFAITRSASEMRESQSRVEQSLNAAQSTLNELRRNQKL